MNLWKNKLNWKVEMAVDTLKCFRTLTIRFDLSVNPPHSLGMIIREFHTAYSCLSNGLKLVTR